MISEETAKLIEDLKDDGFLSSRKVSYGIFKRLKDGKTLKDKHDFWGIMDDEVRDYLKVRDGSKKVYIKSELIISSHHTITYDYLNEATDEYEERFDDGYCSGTAREMYATIIYYASFKDEPIPKNYKFSDINKGYTCIVCAAGYDGGCSGGSGYCEPDEFSKKYQQYFEFGGCRHFPLVNISVS